MDSGGSILEPHWSELLVGIVSLALLVLLVWAVARALSSRG